MYLASRLQAGRMLAKQLAPKYNNKKSAVLALNDGGVMVGAQIAAELHCVLTLLQSSEIMLPREPDAIAAITGGGTVAYNHEYSDGELSDMVSENYGYLEQEKLSHMHDLNQLVGTNGTVTKDLLKGHNVIIVADGFKTGFPIDLAAEFLKPIEIENLVIAAPFASVKAVDHMHIVGDDLYCLNVVAEYIETDHYYDQKDIPDHETIIKTIEQITLNWK